MESFYGGKRGISFELVKMYETKAAMMQDFLQSNCTVDYGQYVQIDSGDAINGGEIYRRTENINNGSNGAVLVGKIAGASGSNSIIDLVPYSSLGATASSGSMTVQDEDLIPGTAAIDSIAYKFQTVYDSIEEVYRTRYGIQLPYNVIELESDTTDEQIASLEKVVDAPFYQKYTLKIPKYLNNNTIKRIILVEKNQLSTIEVYDYTTKERILSSDKDMMVYSIEETELDENDESITVVKNYKICNFSTLDSIFYDDATGIITFNVDGVKTDVSIKQIQNIKMEENGILTATYIDATTSGTYREVEDPTGDPKSQGWYELINDTYVKTIDTTVDETKTYYYLDYSVSFPLNQEYPLKWITNITANSERNSFIINYNTGETDEFPSPLNSIKTVNYDDNTGELTITYTTVTFDEVENPTGNPAEQGWYELIDGNYVETEDEVVDVEKTYYEKNDRIQNLGVIKSITNVTFDETTSTLTIEYNHGASYDNFNVPLRGVASIEYDNAMSAITVTYSDGDTSTIGLAICVSNININKDGQLVLTFNNGSQKVTPQAIIYPTEITFNDTTKKLEMTMSNQYIYTKILEPPVGANPHELNWYIYNENFDSYVLTNDTVVDSETDYYEKSIQATRIISPALNSIEDVAIVPNTYELLILNSDPEKQGDIVFNDKTGWISLGVVKDMTGLFITGVITTDLSTKYPTISKSIESLNAAYPDGYHGNPFECLAIGTELGSKKIYGYDSENTTWYFLGNFSADNVIAAATVSDYKKGLAPEVSNLPVGGVWLVIENAEDITAQSSGVISGQLGMDGSELIDLTSGDLEQHGG